MHWSKLQSNVSLSTADAELNSTVRGLCEATGVWQLKKETLGKSMEIVLHGGPDACRRVRLRPGAGRVKHLCTAQLWVRGAIKAYGVRVVEFSRTLNSADVLVHFCGFEELGRSLDSMRFWRCDEDDC